MVFSTNHVSRWGAGGCSSWWGSSLWALLLGLQCLCGRAAAQDSLQVLPVDAATFVVARAPAHGDGIEGFVVDRDALVNSLRTRVLEEQGLGDLARVVAVRPAGTGMRRGISGFGSGDGLGDGLDPAEVLGFESAYRFAHRFAPPFEQLQAQLDLASLSVKSPGGELLYPLTGGLVLAIVLGLWALYRMVAVRLRFAQRRSNFVAAVSHELKTPLTAIRMYGEMLRDDLVESDEKRKEYYHTISAETERLSRLINNVLELSRLERRERPMDLRVGDVSQVVAEVVELFRPHAEREGVELRCRMASGLPAVGFERDALTQVLFNLLDNALKYGREGQPAPRIEVCCEPAQNGVMMSVRDFGPGVSHQHLHAIFEPFYRAQDELTRRQQGTGIGLSLVQGLCARMGGRVQGRNAAPGFEVRVILPTSGAA